MGSMGAMGLSLPDHIKYITSHTHFLILVISPEKSHLIY